MLFISTSCLKDNKDFYKTLDLFYYTLKIKNIEIGATHGYVADVLPLIKFKKDHDVNFTVHVFFPPTKEPFMINIGSQDPIVIKKSLNVAKTAIELCRKIDAGLYGMHSGMISDVSPEMNLLSKPYEKDKVLETQNTTLRQMMDYAKEYDVRVALENHSGKWHNINTKADDMLATLKEVNSKNLGILLDIGHLAGCFDNKALMKKEVEKIQDKILEIHVHEFRNGIDHHNISTTKTMDVFDRSFLKKVIVTLEAFALPPEEILKGKEILEKAIF